MLSNQLFRAFNERGLIVLEETEFEAWHETKNPFDELIRAKDVFTIETFEDTGKTIFLNLYRSWDGKKATVTCDDVYMIDGMDPERLALAYDMNSDGTPNMIMVDWQTDAKNEIIGKINCTLNGIELRDGTRMVLCDDKTSKMNGVLYTVRGVGRSIELKKPRGRPKKIRSLEDLEE